MTQPQIHRALASITHVVRTVENHGAPAHTLILGPCREVSLSWIAFGLLLAAWSVSDDDPMTIAAAARPQYLKGYANVSVRAVCHRHSATNDST